jgi:hypothetical protein
MWSTGPLLDVFLARLPELVRLSAEAVRMWVALHDCRLVAVEGILAILLMEFYRSILAFNIIKVSNKFHSFSEDGNHLINGNILLQMFNTYNAIRRSS